MKLRTILKVLTFLTIIGAIVGAAIYFLNRDEFEDDCFDDCFDDDELFDEDYVEIKLPDEDEEPTCEEVEPEAETNEDKAI